MYYRRDFREPFFFLKT